MSNEQQQQSNDNSKVIKQYEATLKKLVAVIGGAPLAPASKIPVGVLGEVIDELFKEDRETLGKELKEGVRNLLKQKVEMDKAFKQKEDELAKLKIEKYKEFNKASNHVFSKIENLGTIEAQYYAALNQAGEAVEVSNPEVTEVTKAPDEPLEQQ
jgi:hypothetical protein